MQLPTRNTPITRCETAGAFTQGALRRYTSVFETTPEQTARLESLADTVAAATAMLVEAQNAYRAAVLRLVPLRLMVRLVDLRSDEHVRNLKRATDTAGKEISAVVFPKGVTPIVRPVGRTQVDALRAVEGRLAAAAKWQARDTELPRLVAVREQYEAALTSRKEAMVATAALRAQRDAVKEDFLDAFAAVAGAVREVFPRDQRRQDVFFDALRSRSSADPEEPDEPVDPPIDD